MVAVKMGILLVLLGLVALTMCRIKGGSRILLKYRKEAATCKKESNATSLEIGNVNNGQFSDTPELQKFTYCFTNKLHVFTNNSIDKGAFMNIIKEFTKVDDDKATEVVEKCAQQEGEPEEIAYEVFKCMSNETD